MLPFVLDAFIFIGAISVSSFTELCLQNRVMVANLSLQFVNSFKTLKSVEYIGKETTLMTSSMKNDNEMESYCYYY